MKDKIHLEKQIVDYRKGIQKKHLIILILFLMTVVLIFISMNAGAASVSIPDIFKAIFGKASLKTNAVVMNLRLPRIVAGIIAGIGLAISGCIMQNNLRNPLASPSTLGITHAAAFGANVAIIIFGAGSVSNRISSSTVISNPYIVTLTALFFALIAMAVILSLSKLRSFSPESIVLAGVAISSLFSAATMIVQYFASDSTEVASVIFWTFGDLGRISWSQIAILTVCTVLAMLYFWFRRWDYNALDSGEDTAKSLGVNVDRVRLGGLLVSSILSAVCVAFLGIIAFIGLVAPQISKIIVGSDKRFLLPSSALLGALLLLLSDTLARVILSPQTLPVGAVTSFLGAPLFLYLLMKGRKA